MLRSSVHAELYQALLQLAAEMRMPIEGLHTETGPGVMEAALQYTESLEAADRAALFKTFTKVLMQRRGLMATFMAKWSEHLPGQSGHLHISMARQDGSAAFYDANKPHTMSDEMRWFVGGQQALDAGTAGHGGLDRQQLLASGARLLGADLRHLGSRESHLRAARHPGRCEEPAGRVPDRRRRHQPLPRDRGGDRLGTVGHRTPHRA